ncbi:MAG: methionyl-tRNA formyltransferase [Balneola sp.]|nr:methionyl-tRNA formyltransferase [Balneola sp.]
MGSPDFAIPSLEKIFNSNHTIQAVVSNVDKRRGRGSELAPTIVKSKALELGLPVIEVEDLKSEEFEKTLKELNPDLFVVVAFRILPKNILEIPKIGSINLHASLLPKFRGAAPIHWAVIKGEVETGCTIFFLDEKVDTGNIILQKKIPIGDNDTTGDIYSKLMEEGSEQLLAAIDLIESDNYDLKKQEDSKATPAPKLFNENTRIDFTKTAGEVHNLIRGLNPFPVAWTTWNDKKVKIFSSKLGPEIKVAPSKLLEKEGKLLAGCREGTIEITELQLPGKKRMSSAEFINGYTVEGYFK